MATTARKCVSVNDILVNGEKDIRRGRKLRPGDIVEIEGQSYELCS